MIFTFRIEGETPAKKNSRIINTKTGRSFPSKKYTEWHKSALVQLMQFPRPDKPIDTPVRIVLKFTHGDLRRRDSDNGCSSIMDLLVDAGILADDNWNIVQDISISNKYEVRNPKCDILIHTLDKS